MAATAGWFDQLSPERIVEASARIRELFVTRLPQVARSIEAGQMLSESDRQKIVKLAEEAVATWKQLKP